MFYKIFGLSIIIYSSAFPTWANQSPDPETAVEKMLDRKALAKAVDAVFSESEIGNSTPGCALGVIENGQWALKKGYGMANLEHNIPLTTKSIFRIASVSKQFTATAIALLAEQGKLDLDVDIRTYLPDLVPYGHKVTTRQMIHHVSGIPDYEPGIAAMKTDGGKDLRLHNQDYLTIREFYDRAKTIPLFAAPETKFSYSNTAYFLLSQIVRAASGQTLRAYARENIFLPLGMEESFFNDEVNDVVKGRADAYTRKKDGSYSIYMTNLSWVGDGGVYTNIDDFIKWDQHFYQNPLGVNGQALIEKMEKTYSVSADYAWGQSVKAIHGQKAFSHTGSWVAFTSFYVRFPDREMSIVTFCNSNVLTAVTLGKKIIPLVLGHNQAR